MQSISINLGYDSLSFEDDWDLDDSIDDIPVLQLLSRMSDVDEDILFHKNGFEKVEKICNTLQGELYRAKTINKDERNSYVAIKKTSKDLLKKKIAIEDDIHFCVSENIVKEAQILKYLTFDHSPIGDYILKYVDFFESEDDYYLVTEYIESDMNLKQFISKSNEYINNGKLSIKEYHTIIKYLFFQLFVTVQWLHDSMHCCHLDLCTENIMLVNGGFTETKTGVSINTEISIKLADFGVSEVFSVHNANAFLCSKQGLSLDNEGYFAPKVFNGDIYDARGADNWRLGMMLFEGITVGKHLYEPLEIYEKNSGYCALFEQKLQEYMMMNCMMKNFNHASFSLLNSLLNIDESKRLMNGVQHRWFKIYFKKYKNQIFKKKAQVKHEFPFSFYKI